jgi:UDP-sulfoquinovose synthase
LKILVIGCGGYYGWPTAFYLSDAGHDVAIVDKFVRRHQGEELGTRRLTAIVDPSTRLGVSCR